MSALCCRKTGARRPEARARRQKGASLRPETGDRLRCAIVLHCAAQLCTLNKQLPSHNSRPITHIPQHAPALQEKTKKACTIPRKMVSSLAAGSFFHMQKHCCHGQIISIFREIIKESVFMVFKPKDKKESDCINLTFWDSVENGDVSEEAAREVQSKQKYSPVAFIKSTLSKMSNADPSRKSAITIAVVVVIAAGVLIYISNGHRITNDHKAIAGALLDQNQSMTRQLTEAHYEFTDLTGKYEESLGKIDEMADLIESSDSTLSDLVSENVDKNKIIEEQQLTIEEQQVIISNQQQTIEVQQTAIDRTDDIFSEIAGIIGQDVNSRSGSSMYSALEKIQKAKEVISSEIGDAQSVKQYCDELDAKAAEIRDQLKRYPDYEPAPGLISYTYGNHNGKFHKGLDVFN